MHRVRREVQGAEVKSNKKRVVWVVVGTNNTSEGGDSFTISVQKTLIGAYNAAFKDIAGRYVDGNWQSYEPADVLLFKKRLEDGLYAQALELWNDMSSFYVEIDSFVIADDSLDMLDLNAWGLGPEEED